VLAVFAADRLVRSPLGLLQLVTRVQSVGGKVASYQDGADLDTTSDTGELLLFVRGWLARMELRLIRVRTVAGLNAARARGVKLGRRLAANAPDPAAVADKRRRGRSWQGIANDFRCTSSAAQRAYQRAIKLGLVGLPENGGSDPAALPVEKAIAK
jgi:DNA invertase Pin-like site-specific DNA recombinase